MKNFGKWTVTAALCLVSVAGQRAWAQNEDEAPPSDALRAPAAETLSVASQRIGSLDSSAGARWEILPPGFDRPTPDARPPPQALNGRPVQVPANLHADGVPLDANRSVWYRLRFVLNRSPVDAMALRLGEISDRDRTYLNGTLIGDTGRWDAVRPQAYDRVRIYEIPAGLLRAGENVLHVRVQAYFAREYGIYRDRVELGPARQIWQSFYLENAFQTFALAAYLTFGLYFLLFFLRRRQERENLFFALFLLSLVVYSLLRTQFKYILGFELYSLKRVQTLAVFAAVPLFYLFIRAYYPLSDRLARVWDRIAWAVHLVPVAGAGIVIISPSTEVWQATVDSLVQPGWLVYIAAVFFILIRESWRRNRDAIIMLSSIFALLVALALDILSGRAIINLPTLLTYAFVLFVISMALVLANRFVRLHDETEDLNRQLARYNQASRRFVPFELLKMLDRGSIVDVALGDQVQKDMTVLFSDIRSFTDLSERMTPEENFAFINSYLRRMGPVIRENHGFIDKYIGDAIMGLFANSADDAFRTAIAMHRALVEWNAKRALHGLQAVAIGAGIHRGSLMLGTIGENERMEGTVISDTVNLAARIEGLTRLYGAAVLTSQATCEALEQPQDFQLRRLDRVRVKGKRQIIDLYELLDVLPESDQAARTRTAGSFAGALQLYLDGRFSMARQAFMDVARDDPGDGAARLFIERCQKLQQSAETGTWDGTTILKSK